MRPNNNSKVKLERGDIHSVVTQWALEAGFLGVETQLEGRLLALVEEAAYVLPGDAGAERDRLLAELSRHEMRWNDAASAIAGYRTRYGAAAIRTRTGIWRGFRTWLWDYMEYRKACTYCRLHGRSLPKARERFEFADRLCIQQAEWREKTLLALRATYEYQKARAAAVRPGEGKNHEHDEIHSFMLHRAN